MSDGTYSKRKVFDPKTMRVTEQLVRTGDAPKAEAEPKPDAEKKAAPKKRRAARRKPKTEKG